MLSNPEAMKPAISTNNKLGKQIPLFFNKAEISGRGIDPVDHRQVWMKDRLRMEAGGNENRKSSRSGSWVSWAMKMFAWGLQATGTFQKGFQNASNIIFREQSLVVPSLPNSFNGFTILFLSDLHLDMMPGLERNIAELIWGREFDLCVMTGDYATASLGGESESLNALKKIVQAIKSRHGILGVLGNHDSARDVFALESIGMNVLINESYLVEKSGSILQFIGTDDIRFYTDQIAQVLKKSADQCTIALVHSPELYDRAAAAGVNVYLCGHTHGGQICLPGGFPVMTNLKRGKPFHTGHWCYKGMQGITNIGVGTSDLPIRFNTVGEVLSITLSS